MLPQKFTMSPMSWKVHLTELVPAGGSSWTMTASEKLSEVVNNVGGVVSIKVKGEVEGGSWPVTMFIEEKNSSAGPLEPEKIVIRSIRDILKEEGLAFASRSEQSRILSPISSTMNISGSPTKKMRKVGLPMKEKYFKHTFLGLSDNTSPTTHTEVLFLLEKKKKSEKKDGLHKFVLWREALKDAKSKDST